MYEMDPAGAAARGAAHLDQTKSGWAGRIDPTELDLWDCYRCVLGQLYGSYDAGVRSLGLSEFYPDFMDLDELDSLPDTVWLGFNAGLPAGAPGEFDAWGLLTQAWRREVRARVAA